MKQKQTYKETITSKEHYEKYANWIKGIKKEDLLNLVRHLYTNKEQLQLLFNSDEHLNNIKMALIDDLEPRVRHILRDKIGFKENGKFYTILSNSQSCSFIKHILIYSILGIKPIFREDILNYNDLWKDWRDLPEPKKYGRKHLSPERFILSKREDWVLK